MLPGTVQGLLSARLKPLWDCQGRLVDPRLQRKDGGVRGTSLGQTPPSQAWLLPLVPAVPQTNCPCTLLSTGSLAESPPHFYLKADSKASGRDPPSQTL